MRKLIYKGVIINFLKNYKSGITGCRMFGKQMVDLKHK